MCKTIVHVHVLCNIKLAKVEGGDLCGLGLDKLHGYSFKVHDLCSNVCMFTNIMLCSLMNNYLFNVFF